MSAVVPEDTPEIKRATRGNHLVSVLLTGLAVATFLAAVSLVIFRFSDSAKQSTTQQIANDVLSSNERRDCVTEYNSLRNVVIERRNTLAITAQQDIIGYLLGQVPTEKLAANKAAMTEANAAVANLPTLPEMAEKGFRDETGVSHPPCPKVS